MSMNNYYDLAMNDLEYLNAMRNSKFYNRLAIDSQQVCEKLAKYIYSTYVSIDDQEERFLITHSVHNIVRECNKKLGENFDYESLRKLSDYYFNAGYPGIDFVELTKNECDDALVSIDNFVSEVNRFLERQENKKEYDTKLFNNEC